MNQHDRSEAFLKTKCVIVSLDANKYDALGSLFCLLNVKWAMNRFNICYSFYLCIPACLSANLFYT